MSDSEVYVSDAITELPEHVIAIVSKTRQSFAIIIRFRQWNY